MIEKLNISVAGKLNELTETNITKVNKDTGSSVKRFVKLAGHTAAFTLIALAGTVETIVRGIFALALLGIPALYSQTIRENCFKPVFETAKITGATVKQALVNAKNIVVGKADQIGCGKVTIDPKVEKLEAEAAKLPTETELSDAEAAVAPSATQNEKTPVKTLSTSSKMQQAWTSVRTTAAAHPYATAALGLLTVAVLYYGVTSYFGVSPISNKPPVCTEESRVKDLANSVGCYSYSPTPPEKCLLDYAVKTGCKFDGNKDKMYRYLEASLKPGLKLDANTCPVLPKIVLGNDANTCSVPSNFPSGKTIAVGGGAGTLLTYSAYKLYQLGVEGILLSIMTRL